MKLPLPLDYITRPAAPVALTTMGWIVLAVLVFDQATKFASAAWLMGRPPYIVVPQLLNFYYDQNTGAAFSMFTGKTVVLSVVSLAVALAVFAWAWKLPKAEHGLRFALGLILGGAIGNLIDRVRLGYVIDFIQAHWMWRNFWPTFNIADSAICVGVALLFIANLRMPAPLPAPVPDAGIKGKAAR